MDQFVAQNKTRVCTLKGKLKINEEFYVDVHHKSQRKLIKSNVSFLVKGIEHGALIIRDILKNEV